jgi:hypothetical protein
MGRIIRALIGGCKQRRPDIDAERLCGLEVNLAALCFSLAATVCTENLSSGVVVVKSAKDGVRFNASDSLNLASDRRIFVQ